MSAFQIAGISIATLMALVSMARALRSSGRRAVSVLWAILWVAAGVAFVFPDGTTVIAQSVGIERGADMVTYSAILAGIIGFWLISLRLRAQARQITLLTREIALRDARPAADHGESV